MIHDIAIYGAGGLGREVYCLIQKINSIELKWNVVGFFDDIKEKGLKNDYGVILGGIQELNQWNTELNVVIAFGDRRRVKILIDQIHNPKICYPNIIYGITIDDSNTVHFGKGNIMRDGCGFTCNCSVGDFNLLNGDVKTGHDDKIGNFNTFMPGVRVSGSVKIGDENFFGVGSIIIQGISIDYNVKLGAGSVLMRNPQNNNLYLGNPAKIFKF